jgi:hypothetical protein
VAKERNILKLFALSTQAFTYFQKKCGFTEGTPEDLPKGRREKYDQSGRNSKVLIKNLDKVVSNGIARALAGFCDTQLTDRSMTSWPISASLKLTVVNLLRYSVSRSGE